MKHPKISVIVIVLNGENFISEALESVAAQSFDEWELIIVDDGSSDRTREIALEFSSRHPFRTRVLEHPEAANRGMSASRNLGIEHARGMYTTFLDHDDVYEPEKLASMLAAAERHPDADAVIGPNSMWYSWNEESQPSTDRPQILGITTETVLDPPGMINGFLSNSSTTPLGPLIRTETLRTLGGYDPAFKGMHEDQVFMVRLMLRHPIVVIDDVLHRYRQHPESCVARTHANGRDKQARYRFLVWMKMELAGQDSRHPELEEQIEVQMRECRGRHGRRAQRILINLRETLTGENQ